MSTVKKIAFKVDSFPNVSETFVTNAVVQALKENFEVIIIVNHLNDIHKSSQKQIIEQHDLISKTLEFKQPTSKLMRYKELLLLIFRPIILKYFLKYCYSKKKISLEYIFHLKFYYEIRGVDAFHVHFFTSLKPLLVLKKIGFLNSKLIVTFHGYDVQFLPSKKVDETFLSDMKILVECLTVNSIYLKNKLLECGFNDSDIQVVPIGIDTDFFKVEKNAGRQPAQKSLDLITVGRLIPLKGQFYGIMAIKKVIDLGNHVNYTIVGEGKEIENLKALVKRQQLEEFVVFKNFQSQQEVKRLLQHHDVFLMTSTHDLNGRREAFGLVSLEAQAMGLPVIGFDSGGFPETLIQYETGFIVPDRDIDAMAAKIILFIKDRTTLKEMSKNARAHISEKHSLNKYSFTHLY